MYVDLLKEIDFSKELGEQPEIKTFMKEAAKTVVKEQLDSLIKFKKPEFDEDLQNHLIVTNIPNLKGKQDKFKTLFEGFLEKKSIGKKAGLESFEVGAKEINGERVFNQTLYMIYKTTAAAKKAYQKLHLLKFDKQHTFSCFTVKEFHAVERISDDYIVPKLFSKKEEIQFNFDENMRDQFVIRAHTNEGDQIHLNWFDNMSKEANDAQDGKPILAKSAVNNVVFSHRGNYCAVCEADGVRVYVGQTLKEKAFFQHMGVIDVAFSPNETYLISFNGNDSYTKTQQNLIVWGLQEEIKITSFKAHPNQDLQSFQFTKDEARLAIVGNGQIYLHSSENVLALKKSLLQSEDDLIAGGNLLKYSNIQKILWLPDGKNLTCVCYDLNPVINSNSSSKIFFFNTETKEERKWRAIGQHIKKIEINISDYNEWISVSFKKVQKKNHHASGIYIVNLMKREVETEVIEIKENVVSLSWDKRNSRFGVVYELASVVKNAHVQFGVLFYQVVSSREKHTQNVQKISEIKCTPANRLILTQNGSFFALYNISVESSGRYKFTIGSFGKDNKTRKPTIEIIKENVEVAYMKFFDIDFSGRFILLGTDKAYHIWSMAGELVYKDIFNFPIFNVKFRPRYMTHLPLEGEKKLVDREKQIQKKYQEEDKKRMNFLEYEREKQKQIQREQFKVYLAAKKEWFSKHIQKRDAERGFSEKDPKIKTSQFEYLQRGNN